MGTFSTDVSRAEALLRAADALLYALGSGEVILVVPATGLAPAAAEQLSLAPAVVRNLGSSTGTRTRLEVMLSASTVNAQAESRNFDPPQALFDAALGILYREKLWRIESVRCESFAGAPYLYRIVLSD